MLKCRTSTSILVNFLPFYPILPTGIPTPADTTNEARNEENDLKYSDKDLLRLRITGCPTEDSDFDNEDTAVREALADTSLGEAYEEDECLALGTWVGEGHQIFDVIIHYRDPQALATDPPRSWSLEVSAMNRQSAVESATRDFRLLESLSSGPWQREILAIEVSGDEALAPAAPAYALALS